MVDKLIALQKSFKDQLPDKVNQIETFWQQLIDRETSGPLLIDLHRAVHSLSGSVGSFGAMALSNIAREFEQTLQPLLAKDRHYISNTEKQRINFLLIQLKQAADEWQPSENLSEQDTRTGKHKPGKQVCLISNDHFLDYDLVACLEKAHYKVKYHSDLGELETACKNELPSVLIVYITTEHNVNNLESFLTDAKTRIKPNVPVLLISDQDNIESRLIAVRSGIQHYFSKPLENKKLIRYLDDFISRSRQKLRVLIIDDDDILLEYHATLLKNAGMEIETLANPMLALDYLENFKPDIILMDVYMPACSGPELTQVIRQHETWSLIPIVFISTKSDLDRQLIAINQGGDDYLVKPVEPERLVSVIVARATQSQKFSLLNNQLKNALRENKFQIETMNQHDIVSAADIAGNIIEVNDKFCAISGYSRAELLGQNHRLLKSGFHPDSFYEEMWKTISNGNVWHGTICNLRKDGGEYWVDSTIVPFLDNKGKPYKYVSARTDITSLRQSEERLHRSQLFANIGTWDWNIKTGDLYWSEKVGPLFGFAEEVPEKTYEKFIDSIHPDDRQMVIQAINNCIENGTDYNIEHRVIRADGEVRWVQEKGDVVRNENGEPLHMLGVVQDIHSRKIAEIALAEHQIQLLEAQSMAQLGNWQANMLNGALSWSEEVYRIFGYKPGEMEPSIDAFLSAVHPDDMELVRESEKKAALTGVHDVVHRIIRQDGEIRYVHELAEAEINTEGTLVRLKGTVQDITETYAMQEQLEQQRKLLNMLHQATTSFVEHRDFREATKNMLEALIEVSDSEYGFTGEIFYDENKKPYLVTDAISDISWNKKTKEYYERFHSDGLEFRNLNTLYGHVMTTQKSVVSNEISTDPRSGGIPKGHPALHSFLGVPIFHGEELVGMYGIANRKNGYDEDIQQFLKPFDTTYGAIIHSKRILEREEQNRKELVQARDEAEQANQAKSQFLSRMSHELRTPMNAIMGFAQLLRMEDEQPLNESQQEDVNEILKAGSHLLDLINDVLDLSKIESGKIQIKLQNVQINDIIHQCILLVHPLAEDNHVTIVDNISDKEYSVSADPVRVKQIFLNLLSNAIKYNSDHGYVTLDSELVGNEKLRISISDTGKGLSEDDIKKLFEPFERLDALENVEGAGIGLVITKHLLELMNGEIGVESTGEKGSTFWIELPIAKENLS